MVIKNTSASKEKQLSPCAIQSPLKNPYESYKDRNKKKIMPYVQYYF